MSPDNSRLDILLRNGTVIDGSGGPRYVADVGIKNGYIMRIGDLSRFTADTVVDVTGLIVAPGFIDNNGGASSNALPEARSYLTQGVTFEKPGP